MIYIPEVPKTLHSQRERRAHDDTRYTLLVVHEADGSWAIHGLGAPGVRPSRDAMVTVAAQILERAR